MNIHASARFDNACNGLLGAVQRAADPSLSEWAPYVGCGGYRINVALWWVRCVVQMARTAGLYPTMAQLEAEAREQHGGGWCECHCDRCGEPLERDPIYGTTYALCGDCHGGREVDGEAFRGGEAAAYEREQQAAAQRLK